MSALPRKYREALTDVSLAGPATLAMLTLIFAPVLIVALLSFSDYQFGARTLNWIGLDNPRTALIFGGVMGTTSGVAAGLAATDEKLVPYGAMAATFYTGIGCLFGPSIVFIVIRAIVG